MPAAAGAPAPFPGATAIPARPSPVSSAAAFGVRTTPSTASWTPDASAADAVVATGNVGTGSTVVADVLQPLSESSSSASSAASDADGDQHDDDSSSDDDDDDESSSEAGSEPLTSDDEDEDADEDVVEEMDAPREGVDGLQPTANAHDADINFGAVIGSPGTVVTAVGPNSGAVIGSPGAAVTALGHDASSSMDTIAAAASAAPSTAARAPPLPPLPTAASDASDRRNGVVAAAASAAPITTPVVAVAAATISAAAVPASAMTAAPLQVFKTPARPRSLDQNTDTNQQQLSQLQPAAISVATESAVSLPSTRATAAAAAAAAPVSSVVSAGERQLAEAALPVGSAPAAAKPASSAASVAVQAQSRPQGQSEDDGGQDISSGNDEVSRLRLQLNAAEQRIEAHNAVLLDYENALSAAYAAVTDADAGADDDHDGGSDASSIHSGNDDGSEVISSADDHHHDSDRGQHQHHHQQPRSRYEEHGHTADTRAQADAYSRTLTSLRDSLTDLRLKEQSLTEELLHTRQQLADSQTRATSQGAALTVLEHETDALRSQLRNKTASLQQEVNSLRSVLVENQKNVEAAMLARDQALRERDDAIQARNSAEKSHFELASLLEQTRSRHSSEMAKLQLQLSRLSASEDGRMAAVADELATAQVEVISLRHDRTTVEALLTTERGRSAFLQQRIDELSASLADSQQAAATSRMQYQQSESSVKALSALILHQLTPAMREMQGKVETLQHFFKDAMSQFGMRVGMVSERLQSVSALRSFDCVVAQELEEALIDERSTWAASLTSQAVRSAEIAGLEMQIAQMQVAAQLLSANNSATSTVSTAAQRSSRRSSATAGRNRGHVRRGSRGGDGDGGSETNNSNTNSSDDDSETQRGRAGPAAYRTPPSNSNSAAAAATSDGSAGAETPHGDEYPVIDLPLTEAAARSRISELRAQLHALLSLQEQHVQQGAAALASACARSAYLLPIAAGDTDAYGDENEKDQLPATNGAHLAGGSITAGSVLAFHDHHHHQHRQHSQQHQQQLQIAGFAAQLPSSASSAASTSVSHAVMPVSPPATPSRASLSSAPAPGPVTSVTSTVAALELLGPEQLRLRLSAALHDISVLRSRLASSVEALSWRESVATTRLTSESSLLRHELEKAAVERASLEQKVADLQRQLQSERSAHEEAIARSESSRVKAVMTAKDASLRSRARAQQVESQLESLRVEHSQTLAECRRLERELVLMSERHAADHKKQLDAFTEQIQKAHVELESVRQQREEDRKRNEGSIDKLVKMREDMAALKRERNALLAALSQMPAVPAMASNIGGAMMHGHSVVAPASSAQQQLPQQHHYHRPQQGMMTLPNSTAASVASASEAIPARRERYPSSASSHYSAWAGSGAANAAGLLLASAPLPMGFVGAGAVPDGASLGMQAAVVYPNNAVVFGDSDVNSTSGSSACGPVPVDSKGRRTVRPLPESEQQLQPQQQSGLQPPQQPTLPQS